MAKKKSYPSQDPKSPQMDPLANEIITRFKAAQSHYSDWDEVAREDYQFALGDQWSEEDRNTLAQQGRPCLTFNRIRPVINIISGYERENSSRIKVNPEGGEDKNFSEVMDRSMKAIGKWSNLEYKMGYWFDDGCYCGKGWLECVITFDDDPIRGELRFKQLTPYQCKVDPECMEYDINVGARYCFKVVRLPKSELLELYPNKKKLINGFVTDKDDPIENGSGIDGMEGADDDYGNRPNVTMKIKRTSDEDAGELEGDEKFTVKEYWRYKKVSKFFVVDAKTGIPEKFDTKEEAQTFIASQGFGNAVERKVKEMWVAAMVSGHILQDEKSPFEPFYHGFPFFRYIAEWAPNSEDEAFRVQGVTRQLKDPQREKNKSKSQTLHILNTQANSGWVGDEEALTPEGWKKLEEMGSKPGVTIKKRKGTELREILPKGPNQGHILREQQADEEFKQISNVNPDLLGMQQGGTDSGKAISLRIRQAVLSLSRMFYNYRYSKEIIGNFMLEMMPMLFDAKKLEKTLGPEYMKKAVDPQKYPDGLTEGNLEAFLQMVKDHRYDVYVTEADANKTVRYEILQQMTDLLKAGAPIPIDLVIEYMDLPNSEEVMQRVREAQQQQMAAMAAAGKGKPTNGASAVPVGH